AETHPDFTVDAPGRAANVLRRCESRGLEFDVMMVIFDEQVRKEPFADIICIDADVGGRQLDPLAAATIAQLRRGVTAGQAETQRAGFAAASEQVIADLATPMPLTIVEVDLIVAVGGGPV